jgi:dTDP-4-amino-4,6-dideoxygalactose transaminase
MQNPFKVVEDFEESIAEYAGSKYAVAVDSCTNALTLCCDYFKVKEAEIPKHTYVSVPQSIMNAGGKVSFRDSDKDGEGNNVNWQTYGYYSLAPYPIVDSARLLTGGMYKIITDDIPFMGLPCICLSLHWGKTLNLGQGGVILTDSIVARDYFRKARWDGRTAGVAPKDDEITFIGRHCPMSPRDAADALTRLHFLPKHNKPLPEEKGYADLSKFGVFNVGK